MLLRFSYFLSLSLALFFASGLDAQGRQFEWPEKPENVKVLSETISGDELSAVMRTFTSALGVRCSHCHVGEGPLSDYDFASDDKPEKEKARVMMRMTRAINQEYVSEFTDLEESTHERVNVTCMTCHRNVSRPMMLEDLLADTYESGGIDEVKSTYGELHEAFYGGFAYDFREGTLTRLAEELAAQEETEGALQVLDLESELHPEFANAFRTRGEILANAGRTEEAVASYEKGMELAPMRAKGMFQEQIDRLKNQ